MSECNYPKCNCPFDMGPDNKCLRGLGSPPPEPKGASTELLCVFRKQKVKGMNIDFDFNGNNFLAGAISCAALLGAINIWWLLCVPFFLTSFEIKGMPYATLSYKSGEGWKFKKGRYT